MTTYSADYLNRLLRAVEEFERAFNRWMETQHELTHEEARGLLPTVRPKGNQDEAEVRQRELDVAEKLGPASRAVAVTGFYMLIQGIGTVDPLANWSLMSSPKALVSPRDVRMTAADVRGRLKSMIIDAEAAADSGVPGFAPANLHPTVWGAASAHWTIHQYRVAVREAAEALTKHWEHRLGRSDANATSFWQETLSPGDPKPGKPKLVWPGDPEDKTSKNMRGGLGPLAKSLTDLATGVNLTVRNNVTHNLDELSEQEAMERLAAYSYLARLLDKCEVRTAEADEGPRDHR